MSIYYFGYYTGKSNPNDFIEFPGCNIKMSYIIDSIKRNEIPLRVVCLGESSKSNNSKLIEIDNFETNIFLATTSFKSISRLYLTLQVLYQLLIKINRKDTVIYYHSLYLLPFFKMAKIIKGFKLILEVEESYMAAWNKRDFWINIELFLLKGADAYIFVNDLFPKILRCNQPYAVCYGNYSSFQKKPNQTDNSEIEFNQHKATNLVYAGLISDCENSDVYLALETVKKLPSNYKLRVLGYGSESAILKLNNYIEKNKLSNKVFYHGFLKGESFNSFLRECDIALNPRVLEDKLSNYTFPSKVLTYLSNGLSVVSTPIKCIQSSKIKEAVFFSKDNTSESLAFKITGTPSKKDHSSLIKELNLDFVKKIKLLLKDK